MQPACRMNGRATAQGKQDIRFDGRERTSAVRKRADACVGGQAARCRIGGIKLTARARFDMSLNSLGCQMTLLVLRGNSVKFIRNASISKVQLQFGKLQVNFNHAAACKRLKLHALTLRVQKPVDQPSLLCCISHPATCHQWQHALRWILVHCNLSYVSLQCSTGQPAAQRIQTCQLSIQVFTMDA